MMLFPTSPSKLMIRSCQFVAKKGTVPNLEMLTIIRVKDTKSLLEHLLQRNHTYMYTTNLNF